MEAGLTNATSPTSCAFPGRDRSARRPRGRRPGHSPTSKYRCSDRSGLRDTYPGLATQVLVFPGDDDHLVSNIGGLADKRGAFSGLASLHIVHPHAVEIEGASPCGSPHRPMRTTAPTIRATPRALEFE